MLILIPVDQKTEVNESFARAPHFLIYDSKTKVKTLIDNESALSSGGAGVKAAQNVVDLKISVVLTPRLGENAALILNRADVRIYKTVSNKVNDNISLFFEDKLLKLENFSSGH